MARKRLYEIARELDVESRDVIERATELGLEVKTASSSVDEDEAALIVLAFSDATGETQAAEGQEPDEEHTELDEEHTEPDEGAESEEAVPESPATPEIIEVELGITATDLAGALGQPVGEIVKTLLQKGHLVAANAPVPGEAIKALEEPLGVLIELQQPDEPEAPPPVAPAPEFDDPPEALEPRPPVVTVMGHVDHGKTTLLDNIRHTNVVESEAGGITQHIGAYQVEQNGHQITVIDTPGHEAFTAMRARGANVTDIVVLVVAADDGPMPQTVEAIDHAKAADVNIIVAINKMDLPAADPHNVRARLTEHGLISEELGGDTVTVELSAETGQGVDTLLEMIELVAEVSELKANPSTTASGVVIESQLDKGMGPVATVIVRRGTLRVGDSLVASRAHGRVRALVNDSGERVKMATPSTPVLVLGWSDVPTAGDYFEVVKNDRVARELAEEHEQARRSADYVVPTAGERMQLLLDQLRAQDSTELRLIVKTDAHGSLEALREAIAKITREAASVTVLHGAVGGITESDITFAKATDAVVVGFNVRPDAPARRSAESAGIEIRTYRVIYEMLDEIEQMLVGRLAPDEVEALLGSAEVRAVFKVPRRGRVAGCFVTEGEIQRGAKARLVRDGIVAYDGRVDSLRRFKDDVSSVASGFECGIGLEDYSDVKEGDVIEVYEVREVART